MGVLTCVAFSNFDNRKSIKCLRHVVIIKDDVDNHVDKIFFADYVIVR